MRRMASAQSSRCAKAELVLLVMGFLKPVHPQYPKNVIICGDALNGPSLVVKAPADGLRAADEVDRNK